MKIGLISDIHEDKVRLNEAFTICEKRQCDSIVCLGDITGFDVRHYRHLSTRDASYCVEAVRRQCLHLVAGNHDLFSARRIPDSCQLFTYSPSWYGMDYADRKKEGEGRVWLYEEHDLSPCLRRKEIDYLYHLPEYVILEAASRRILLTHSIDPDISGSAIWRPRKTEDFQLHFALMKQHRCTIGISGHFHPAGAEIATPDRYRCVSFGDVDLYTEPLQLIVPCVAAGSGYNGLLIIDLKTLSGEVVPIKTRPSYFRRFV